MNGKIYEGSQLLGDVDYSINSTLESHQGVTLDNEIAKAAGFRSLQGKLNADRAFLKKLFCDYDNRFLLELGNGKRIRIAMSSSNGTFQSNPNQR